jgi:NAD(P)-dependent dehydrogenase (short-subunit alcohol dehydrogenase family)
VAIVTGVSRRIGIGMAAARRLATSAPTSSTPDRHRPRRPGDRERVTGRFPAGRRGAPEDAARLVAWLSTDDAAWISGQVIAAEGGFRRSN